MCRFCHTAVTYSGNPTTVISRISTLQSTTWVQCWNKGRSTADWHLHTCSNLPFQYSTHMINHRVLMAIGTRNHDTTVFEVKWSVNMRFAEQATGQRYSQLYLSRHGGGCGGSCTYTLLLERAEPRYELLHHVRAHTYILHKHSHTHIRTNSIKYPWSCHWKSTT